jgi:hypothetical protein
MAAWDEDEPRSSHGLAVTRLWHSAVTLVLLAQLFALGCQVSLQNGARTAAESSPRVFVATGSLIHLSVLVERARNIHAPSSRAVSPRSLRILMRWASSDDWVIRLALAEGGSFTLHGRSRRATAVEVLRGSWKRDRSGITLEAQGESLTLRYDARNRAWVLPRLARAPAGLADLFSIPQFLR